jgi:hypothetical protein
MLVLGTGLRAENQAGSVTMRVHDYADVDAARLATAQELVTRLYGRIGVRVQWLSTVRSYDRTDPACRCAKAPTDVTIVITDARGKAKRRVADGVLGIAAVGGGGMGRVAYVMFDRVRDVAVRGATEQARVLSVVIAHEVGHLLLPSGAHTPSGLMRARWQPSEFHRAAVQGSPFSSADAEAIRQALERRREEAAGVPAN